MKTLIALLALTITGSTFASSNAPDLSLSCKQESWAKTNELRVNVKLYDANNSARIIFKLKGRKNPKDKKFTFISRRPTEKKFEFDLTPEGEMNGRKVYFLRGEGKVYTLQSYLEIGGGVGYEAEFYDCKVI